MVHKNISYLSVVLLLGAPVARGMQIHPLNETKEMESISKMVQDLEERKEKKEEIKATFKEEFYRDPRSLEELEKSYEDMAEFREKSFDFRTQCVAVAGEFIQDSAWKLEAIKEMKENKTVSPMRRNNEANEKSGSDNYVSYIDKYIEEAGNNTVRREGSFYTERKRNPGRIVPKVIFNTVGLPLFVLMKGAAAITERFNPSDKVGICSIKKAVPSNMQQYEKDVEKTLPALLRIKNTGILLDSDSDSGKEKRLFVPRPSKSLRKSNPFHLGSIKEEKDCRSEEDILLGSRSGSISEEDDCISQSYSSGSSSEDDAPFSPAELLTLQGEYDEIVLASIPKQKPDKVTFKPSYDKYFEERCDREKSKRAVSHNSFWSGLAEKHIVSTNTAIDALAKKTALEILNAKEKENPSSTVICKETIDSQISDLKQYYEDNNPYDGTYLESMLNY